VCIEFCDNVFQLVSEVTVVGTGWHSHMQKIS